MNRRASRRHAAGVVFLLLGLYAMTALPAAAAEKQYVSTTIRGTLTHPKSDKPLVGAVVRFTATDHVQKDVEALTDDTGTFVAEGLGYGVSLTPLPEAA